MNFKKSNISTKSRQTNRSSQSRQFIGYQISRFTLTKALEIKKRKLKRNVEVASKYKIKAKH